MSRAEMARHLSITEQGLVDLGAAWLLPAPSGRGAKETWSVFATESAFADIPRWRLRPYWTPPFVYFMRSGDEGGPIKIGVSTDIAARLRHVQSHHVLPITLLATEYGGRIRERQLHRRFLRFRVRGEWFRAGEPLMEYIAAIAPEDRP